MSTFSKILLIVAPVVIEYVIAYYMQEQKKESKSHDNDSDSVSSTEHVLWGKKWTTSRTSYGCRGHA